MKHVALCSSVLFLLGSSATLLACLTGYPANQHQSSTEGGATTCRQDDGTGMWHAMACALNDSPMDENGHIVGAVPGGWNHVDPGKCDVPNNNPRQCTEGYAYFTQKGYFADGSQWPTAEACFEFGCEVRERQNQAWAGWNNGNPLCGG